MNVEGKLHLRVDAALNDELAGLSEDQARQVARSTMPVGSVMTVAGWLLLGGADGGRTGAGDAITELLGGWACDCDADG